MPWTLGCLRESISNMLNIERHSVVGWLPMLVPLTQMIFCASLAPNLAVLAVPLPLVVLVSLLIPGKPMVARNPISIIGMLSVINSPVRLLD